MLDMDNDLSNYVKKSDGGDVAIRITRRGLSMMYYGALLAVYEVLHVHRCGMRYQIENTDNS